MSPEKAMILKLSHPPTIVPELEGLPTNDARTQVITQWRNNDILKTPTYLIEPGVTTSTSWAEVHDYGLIIPNGARVQHIGCYYGKEGRYDQDVANTKIQDNFDFSVWKNTVNTYRPIYKSTTLYANVTAFNNIGSINVQQFNPAILFAGDLVAFSYEKPLLFSKFIADGVASGEIKVGGVIHPDFNTQAVEHYFRNSGQKISGLDIDPSTSIQVITLGKIGFTSDVLSLMPTPSQILSNSMRSYAGKFQDGAFAVQRLNTIAPQWLVGSRPAKQDDGLYKCYTYTETSDGQGHFVALQEQLGDNKAKVLTDTLWSQDMTWTFLRMQGIQSNTQISADINLAPVLIKNYYGFEAQPVWGGPWNGLSRESPKPNIAAMQSLMDVFYGMPDGMEAKYNFLGTILPFLKGLIPTGVSFLKGLFSSRKPAEKSDSAGDAGEVLSKVTSELRRMRLAEEKETPIITTPVQTVTGPPTMPKKRIAYQAIRQRPRFQAVTVAPSRPSKVLVKQVAREVVREERRVDKRIPRVAQVVTNKTRRLRR